MEIVTVWALFGLMVGVISLLFLEQQKDTQKVWSVVFGIAGALIGGIVATLTFSIDIVGFNLPSILAVIIGSVAMILVVHTIYKTVKQ